MLKLLLCFRVLPLPFCFTFTFLCFTYLSAMQHSVCGYNLTMFLLIKPTFCSLRFQKLELLLFFCVLLEIYLSAMQHSVCGYNLTMFLLIKCTFCSLRFETFEFLLFFCVLLEIYLSAMQHSVCRYNLKTYTFTVYSPLTLVGGYASLCEHNFLHSLCLRIVAHSSQLKFCLLPTLSPTLLFVDALFLRHQTLLTKFTFDHVGIHCFY